MQDSPENDAFRRYQSSGDPAAMAEVFDSLAPRLLLLAAHLAGGRSGSEDLLQSTFLAAIEHPERWDGVRPVAGWLVGIMRHRAIDMSRKGGGARAEALRDMVDQGPAPMDAAEQDEVFLAVERGVEGMESPYREVLLLHLVHGLEPRAIGHSLGRSPSATRMQLKRGLERLRGILPREYAPVAAVLGLQSKDLASVRSAVLSKLPPTLLTNGSAVVPVFVGGLIMKWIAGTCIAALMTAWLTLGTRTEAVDLPNPAENAEAAREGGEDASMDTARAAPRRRKLVPAEVDQAVQRLGSRSASPSELDEDALEPSEAARFVHTTGIVVTQEGVPVPSARVYRIEYSLPSRRIFIANADDKGRFDIPRVENRSSLGALADGFAAWFTESVWDENEDGQEELRIAVGDPAVTVAGQVVDEAGDPSPHAVLEFGVYNEFGGMSEVAPNEEARSLDTWRVSAGSDGRFQWPHVPIGEVWLTAASKDGLEIVSQTLWVREAGEEECLLRLGPANEIYGTVRDSWGHPVQGSKVWVAWDGSPMLGRLNSMHSSLGPGLVATTDEEGRYRCRGLRHGYNRIYIPDAPHHDFLLNSGDRKVHDVEVSSRRTLTLTLLGPGESPMVGWRAHVSKQEGVADVIGISNGWMETDVRGRADFSVLGGRTEFYFVFRANPEESSEWDPIYRSASVAPTAREVTVRFAASEIPASTLRGRLLHPDGSPAAHRLVSFHRATKGYHHQEATDASGRYSYRNVWPGVVKVETGPDCEGFMITQVDLMEGETVDLGASVVPFVIAAPREDD